MLQEIKQKIHILIEKYGQNREFYRTSKFNETEVLNLFIDPLFEILEWDIRNTSIKTPMSVSAFGGGTKG